MTPEVCGYCGNKADGAMLVMGNIMAHVPCVVQKLNELLDPDWDIGKEPSKIVDFVLKHQKGIPIIRTPEQAEAHKVYLESLKHRHGCVFCNWTGTLLNQWDNTQDCPVCKNKPWDKQDRSELWKETLKIFQKEGYVLTPIKKMGEAPSKLSIPEHRARAIFDQIRALILPKNKPSLLGDKKIKDILGLVSIHCTAKGENYDIVVSKQLAQAQWDIWNEAIYGGE